MDEGAHVMHMIYAIRISNHTVCVARVSSLFNIQLFRIYFVHVEEYSIESLMKLQVPDYPENI